MIQLRIAGPTILTTHSRIAVSISLVTHFGISGTIILVTYFRDHRIGNPHDMFSDYGIDDSTTVVIAGYCNQRPFEIVDFSIMMMIDRDTL